LALPAQAVRRSPPPAQVDRHRAVARGGAEEKGGRAQARALAGPLARVPAAAQARVLAETQERVPAAAQERELAAVQARGQAETQERVPAVARAAVRAGTRGTSTRTMMAAMRRHFVAPVEAFGQGAARLRR
jgi:hypothetical protein